MLVIGSQFFRSGSESDARQARARAALRALPDARPVNLQFADDPEPFEGLETAAVLRLDSRRVAGGDGPRKPIVSEMFDALASIARREHAGWFAYANADIEVTAPAVERILSTPRDAYAFSRADIDPDTRTPLSVMIYGVDLVAMRVDWWVRERRRFRPYIAGEPCWDNVYAAIACCHGNAVIVNDAPEILHAMHGSAWGRGRAADYNGYLATLDAPYFSRWVQYIRQLEAALAAGQSFDRARTARDVFGPPIGWSVRHVLRQARAHARFARTRIGAR